MSLRTRRTQIDITARDGTYATVPLKITDSHRYGVFVMDVLGFVYENKMKEDHRRSARDLENIYDDMSDIFHEIEIEL